MPAQTLDITRVVVWDSILPTAKSDSDAFERECASGGVMVLPAVSLQLAYKQPATADINRPPQICSELVTELEGGRAGR